MKHIIKLEKEDIKTSAIGLNYQIIVNDELSIVFSKEALDELVSDYKSILEEQSKEGEAKVIEMHDDSKARKAIRENFDILNNLVNFIISLNVDKIIISPTIAGALLQSFELKKAEDKSSSDIQFIGHIETTMVFMDKNMRLDDGSIKDYDTKEILFTLDQPSLEKLF